MSRRGHTPEEWQELRKQSSSYFQDAITTLTPFAGLTANALAHLRTDWITWRDNYVRIDIPATASCNSWKLRSGGGPDGNNIPPLTKRETPCSYCRNNGTTNKFENHWNGDVSSYTAILHRELSEPAVEFLSTVFSTYGRPEFAGHPRSLYREADRLTEESKSKAGSYTRLLRTGPVIYAHYGLQPDEIGKLTVYSVSTVEHIIRATPQVNFKDLDTLSFLKKIAEYEPVTVEELMDVLGLSQHAIQARLSHLNDEGKVSGSNTHLGSPAATWKTTAHWAAPFRCELCGFETHSIGAIRRHRSQEHG